MQLTAILAYTVHVPIHQLLTRMHCFFCHLRLTLLFWVLVLLRWILLTPSCPPSPHSAPPLPPPLLPPPSPSPSLSFLPRARPWTCRPSSYLTRAVTGTRTSRRLRSSPALTSGCAMARYSVFWTPNKIRTLQHSKSAGREVK